MWYRCYDAIMIFSVISICLINIALPVLASFIELYPILIVPSALAHTAGLLLPICGIVLISHFEMINYSSDNDSCHSLILCVIFTPNIIEAIFRLLAVATSWVYCDDPDHALFITTIILSAIATAISLLIIIFEYSRKYQTSRERILRQINYFSV